MVGLQGAPCGFKNGVSMLIEHGFRGLGTNRFVWICFFSPPFKDHIL